MNKIDFNSQPKTFSYNIITINVMKFWWGVIFPYKWIVKKKKENQSKHHNNDVILLIVKKKQENKVKHHFIYKEEYIKIV